MMLAAAWRRSPSRPDPRVHETRPGSRPDIDARPRARPAHDGIPPALATTRRRSIHRLPGAPAPGSPRRKREPFPGRPASKPASPGPVSPRQYSPVPCPACLLRTCVEQLLRRRVVDLQIGQMRRHAKGRAPLRRRHPARPVQGAPPPVAAIATIAWCPGAARPDAGGRRRAARPPRGRALQAPVKGSSQIGELAPHPQDQPRCRPLPGAVEREPGNRPHAGAAPPLPRRAHAAAPAHTPASSPAAGSGPQLVVDNEALVHEGARSRERQKAAGSRQ